MSRYDFGRGPAKEIALLILSAAVVAFTPVLAHEDDILRGFEDCSQLDSDAEQLECFRDALERARGHRVLVAEPADVDDSEHVRHEETAPAVSPPGGQASASERTSARNDGSARNSAERPNGIAATVSSARRTAFGKLVVTLDNGESWLETDGSHYRGAVRPGDAVVISKRRFGGYRMKVNDQPGAVLVRQAK